jgi:hypothetical protein
VDPHKPAACAGPAPRPPNARSRTTNDALAARTDRNTARGRRVADIYLAFMAAMGNPQDTISQANALRAAELKVAAEDARKRMLDGTGGDPDQLVRLENLAARAERRLGIRRPPGAKRCLPPDPHETGRGVGLAELMGDGRD